MRGAVVHPTRTRHLRGAVEAAEAGEGNSMGGGGATEDHIQGAEVEE